MLLVTCLSFGFAQSQILRDVSLTVRPGEIACLIGPNGAGKSTLIKCINHILQPTPRSILIDGRAVEDYRRRELARTVAYVPQQAGPSMSMQVIDVVALGRAPHRGFSTKAEDRAVISAVIERLQLGPLAFRIFGELSGGQRQRVLIARALTQQARLLLMDEATSNLDPFFQLEILTNVQQIAKERNVAVLAALHDLTLAARFGDCIILMNKGGVQAQGSWRDVLTSANVQATFGVGALIGSSQGLPYVIPIQPIDT
jgi:iron complex transport system ATP-binding protein